MKKILLICLALFLVSSTVLAKQEKKADGMADFTEGIRAAKQGASFDAIMFFSKAIDSGTLKPNILVAAYIQRGALWKLTGNKENSIKDFRKVLDLDPTNEEAKKTLKDLGAN